MGNLLASYPRAAQRRNGAESRPQGGLLCRMLYSLWPVKQMGKHEYWDGWHSLTQRIRGVIDARSSLDQERQRLRGDDGDSDDGVAAVSVENVIPH